MLYYNEAGEQLTADMIDLALGTLADRDAVAHPAKTHTAARELPGGLKITYLVTDQPAYTEVISQTYILNADHPSREDELEAALLELAAIAAENAERLDDQEAALVDVAAAAAGGEK